MQTVFQTQPPQTPENSLGSERVPAKPETQATEAEQRRSELATAHDLLNIAYGGGEVAVAREAQKPVPQETHSFSSQTQYADEVLASTVAIEQPRQTEPAPTAIEAVRIVTANAEASRDERLAQIAIDLEREGYDLAA